ncbi:hypothetical protein [Kribbella qitaiheensis]|nr:hypothetical protein [Kribbella qitaiheensis]
MFVLTLHTVWSITVPIVLVEAGGRVAAGGSGHTRGWDDGPGGRG